MELEVISKKIFPCQFRVAVDDNYDNVAYVDYYQVLPEADRFLEDDIVTVYAGVNGLISYESVGAGVITIPGFISVDIVLH